MILLKNCENAQLSLIDLNDTVMPQGQGYSAIVSAKVRSIKNMFYT